jgi:hypothetical protein
MVSVRSRSDAHNLPISMHSALLHVKSAVYYKDYLLFGGPDADRVRGYFSAQAPVEQNIVSCSVLPVSCP